MDAYLDCLQSYIEEHLFEKPSPFRREYRLLASEKDQASSALEATLTEEQAVLWKRYQDKSCLIRALEDDIMFEKAVALGKWMVLS